MSQKSVEILIAEDEKLEAKLIATAFDQSRLANRLSFVQDGDEVLSFLRKEPPFQNSTTPALLLLDINMPRMNGKETLAEIRKDPNLKRLVVVMLTSSDDEEDIFKSYDLGANGYIRKPIDFDDLKKVIESIESFWFDIVTLTPR